MTLFRNASLFAVFAAAPTVAGASCGAAFCNVNSQWTSASAAVEPGSVLDVRYESIRQNQPREGRDKRSVGQVRRHHDEIGTRNENIVATFSHHFASPWGLSISVPLVQRDHAHIHNHHGQAFLDEWRFRALGDVQVVGRYQLPYLGDPGRPVNAGLSFGFKLPTGKTDVANGKGERAERTLQPGTGTTDVVLGAYRHQTLPRLNAAWFAQGQLQQALDERDRFKPGARLSIDLGYRQGLTERFAALAQVNYAVRRRDQGLDAEPADSGGVSVSLSPGAAYRITDRVLVYAHYEWPLVQRVNGVQLTADRSFVLGMSSRF